MAEKSESAFRTISEAAAEIGVPAHVLRFWETRFEQLQPLKRAGGRRYYRPADMALLRRIHHLLQDRGLTIRGAVLALGSRDPAPEPASAPASAPAPAVISAAQAADRQALLAIRNALVAALAA